MKNISRIFSVCLCSASLFVFDAVAVVATNAGDNLTAFNPSTANNNQWASMSNPRNDNVSSAKADFGNCNAIVLRCAQPKCGNGGCSDLSIAAGIVSGCVKSNAKCKQYGDDLINYMSAQLVANSQAKINAANAEQAQAAAQAAAAQQMQQANEAQAATQAALVQQQQQMAEMQSQMQQQMMQMQQQMAEQNAQSAQQIADALAQSQQQQAAAIEDMKSVAQSQPAPVTSSMELSQKQEEAISRGVSADILEREKIAGQVLTEIEDAENALKEVRVAMESAFKYAGCDDRGDNCEGPKRVKKWRELAAGFITPYETVVDKIWDALNTAQVVGVDLSDIYMMLNDSCNSWGEYLCPTGDIVYITDAKGQKGAPRVVTDSGRYNACTNPLVNLGVTTSQCNPNDPSKDYDLCVQNCQNQYSKSCTFVKLLNKGDDVFDKWVNIEDHATSNQTVVACASQALSGSKLFARKSKAKSGANLIDMEQLNRWINQREPNTPRMSVEKENEYNTSLGYLDGV